MGDNGDGCPRDLCDRDSTGVFAYKGGLFGGKKTQVYATEIRSIRIGSNRIRLGCRFPVVAASCSRPSFRRG